MSGKCVYTWKIEGDSVVIEGIEDGKPMLDREGLCAWSWENKGEEREAAQAFWEALQEASEARGDLHTTFIRDDTPRPAPAPTHPEGPASYTSKKKKGKKKT